MLRLTTSSRRLVAGGWTHRGAVRGAVTFQQLDQRDDGKAETSSALKRATQKVSLAIE